jgi:heavy metal sensor kinase
VTKSAEFSATGFRIVARPVVRNGRRQVVVAASSLSPIRRSVRRVLILLVLAFPVALAATAFAGWWLARRALRPIDHMTSTAAAIGPDRLQERVPVPGTADEVAHLASTLNTMLDRIQDGVEAQRQLVADTSHELRTPLAVMRTELDVSLRSDELAPSARAALESAREEVDRMNVTIEDLLTLANADEGQLGLQAETVDLYEVAFDAVASLSGLARARGVNLRLDGDSATVHADADRLRQVLRNLVDNAIKFSPEGGQVAVETRSAPGEAAVTVSDAGSGIPAELHARIFERYFRVDSSRTRTTGGSGLGLAIAGELVGAHGGRIAVENREPCGVAFTVILPSPGADGLGESEPISRSAWPPPVAAAPRAGPGSSRRTAR